MIDPEVALAARRKRTHDELEELRRRFVRSSEDDLGRRRKQAHDKTERLRARFDRGGVGFDPPFHAEAEPPRPRSRRTATEDRGGATPRLAGRGGRRPRG